MIGEPVGTVIVGGGPAGTAVLIAAAKQGRLAELAEAGLVVVERGGHLGGGRLGDYAITSDSTATTFLTATRDTGHPEIAALAGHGAAQAVASHIDDVGVPLVEAGAFLDALGETLHALVEDRGGVVLTGQEAVSAQRTGNGLWKLRLQGKDDHEQEIVARNLVIATGGQQPRWRLERELVAGLPLVARYDEKLVQSGDVLEKDGVAMLRARLAGIAQPRIVIVGGSTSAIAIAVKLLRAASDLVAHDAAITIAHRRPLRPYYPSAEAALADGFDDFGHDDICPVSGFVYRLAGFRLEARDLVLHQLGIGGRAPDARLALHRIGGVGDVATAALLDDASIIIAALGYRPHALPLFDTIGRRIETNAGRLAYSPMVDGHCRIVTPSGRPIPGLYGIGLAAGFVPHGELGGEASFSGQANGLWLWQNGVGFRIVDQLLDGIARQAVA